MSRVHNWAADAVPTRPLPPTATCNRVAIPDIGPDQPIGVVRLTGVTNIVVADRQQARDNERATGPTRRHPTACGPWRLAAGPQRGGPEPLRCAPVGQVTRLFTERTATAGKDQMMDMVDEMFELDVEVELDVEIELETEAADMRIPLSMRCSTW